MTTTFDVFAGRAWPVDEDSDTVHLVGRFPSLVEANRAFSHVRFLRLPPWHGRLRWRGDAPFDGMIVQIEREPDLPLAG